MATDFRRRSYAANASNGELLLECKAAYLSLHNNITDTINSKHAFVTALQQTGRNPTNRIVSKYWKMNTERMTFDEFCDVCKKEPCTTSDDLMKAFCRIDLNNDGYLSLQELYKMMIKNDTTISMAEVKQILDDVDENKDGRLDYSEFCKMVISTSEDCKKMSRKILEQKERHAQKSRRSKGTIHGSKQAPMAAPRSKSNSLTNSKGSHVEKAVSDYKGWQNHTKIKGCYFVEDDNSITSHWYILQLSQPSLVHLSIQTLGHRQQGSSPVDCQLLILSAKDQKLMSVTDTTDSDNVSHIELHLQAGRYLLSPYTTGCILQTRKTSPKTEVTIVKKDKGTNKYTLTRQFRSALEEIFDLCDLDDNGLLSRDEFNQFNVRTSGEQVADEEWRVVEENIDLENGEITKEGFVRLNEMEVEDNDGDVEDSWLTLSNMGFNKALVMDEACPFLIEVYAELCKDINIKVKTLESCSSNTIHHALLQAAKLSGDEKQLKENNSVQIHTVKYENWGFIVCENKSSNDVKIRLDCNGSKNCLSTLANLTATIDLPANSITVSAGFVRRDCNEVWTIQTMETLVYE